MIGQILYISFIRVALWDRFPSPSDHKVLICIVTISNNFRKIVGNFRKSEPACERNNEQCKYRTKRPFVIFLTFVNKPFICVTFVIPFLGMLFLLFFKYVLQLQFSKNKSNLSQYAFD